MKIRKSAKALKKRQQKFSGFLHIFCGFSINNKPLSPLSSSSQICSWLIVIMIRITRKSSLHPDYMKLRRKNLIRIGKLLEDFRLGSIGTANHLINWSDWYRIDKIDRRNSKEIFFEKLKKTILFKFSKKLKNWKFQNFWTPELEKNWKFQISMILKIQQNVEYSESSESDA